LEDIQENSKMLIYHYLNGNDMKITIKFLKSFGKVNSYYNMEDTEVSILQKKRYPKGGMKTQDISVQ